MHTINGIKKQWLDFFNESSTTTSRSLIDDAANTNNIQPKQKNNEKIKIKNKEQFFFTCQKFPRKTHWEKQSTIKKKKTYCNFCLQMLFLKFIYSLNKTEMHIINVTKQQYNTKQKLTN